VGAEDLGPVTFSTVPEANIAAAQFNEEGFQARVIVHRLISTELMRFC
jgi:hypothetical protein